MDVSCAVEAILLVVIAILGWRVLNWVWLRPMKLEKQLRQQGLNGTSYRLLFGDTKEIAKMDDEAKSKPIGLSDNAMPRVFPFLHKYFITHGKIFFGWIGQRPKVYIMDTDIIKEILNKYNQYQKAKRDNPLGHLLANAMFHKDGEQWVKHRKIMNPAFHTEKLKNMLPAFYLSIIEMIEKWEEMVDKEEGSCELDVLPYIHISSVDVISRTAFGTSYEEGRKIFELQSELAALLVDNNRSVYIPGTRFLPTKMNRRLKELSSKSNASIKSIIEKRLEAMKAGEVTSNDDLLGILLESNNKEIKHGNESSGLSIKEIIEECKLFYFAGQEASSLTLVWTMILLSQHQHWQKQAREEVFHVFGNKKPDSDGLSRLKIVPMILYEVLRLYPPAVVLERMIHEEMKIGKYTLPAGVFIQVPIMILHYDRELWGNDANEFKPERFSEGVSKATKGQLSYLPFGYGPRICIGQNFALLEAKMALSLILQRFSFALSPSYSHAPSNAVTLQPQHGAHIVLQKL